MSKTTTSTKSTKATNAKKEQSTADFREAIRIQTAEKAKERKEKAQKEAAPKGKNSKSLRTLLAVKEAQETPTEAKKTPKETKHTGVLNMGVVRVSESVGLHYRVAKGEQAPQEGDIVLATLGKKGEHQIPLLVRTVQPTVSEETFIQCFLLEKGSQHHVILGEAKLNGESCTVQWK